MLRDAQAIQRSVKDPGAFGLIFDRHFATIHRYVRHCLDVEAADDLAAETFVRAFAARKRYVPITRDARAWLLGIAGNLVRDEVRRRSRADGTTRRLASEPAPYRPSATAADPELHSALIALRDEEREVLVLFAWAELSYEEIAHATGAPVGTVRSRLSRARARLRELLAAPSLSAGESR